MKLFLTSILFTFTFPFIASAEENPQLRVGHAHKPDAAKAELDAILASVPDLEAWEKRKAIVKAGILAGAKLTDFPERTPLNVRVTGVIERPGFTVEKTLFESQPGFYVTASLYLPDYGVCIGASDNTGDGNSMNVLNDLLDIIIDHLNE